MGFSNDYGTLYNLAIQSEKNTGRWERMSRAERQARDNEIKKMVYNYIERRDGQAKQIEAQALRDGLNGKSSPIATVEPQLSASQPITPVTESVNIRVKEVKNVNGKYHLITQKGTVYAIDTKTYNELKGRKNKLKGQKVTLYGANAKPLPEVPKGVATAAQNLGGNVTRTTAPVVSSGKSTAEKVLQKAQRELAVQTNVPAVTHTPSVPAVTPRAQGTHMIEDAVYEVLDDGKKALPPNSQPKNSGLFKRLWKSIKNVPGPVKAIGLIALGLGTVAAAVALYSSANKKDEILPAVDDATPPENNESKITVVDDVTPSGQEETAEQVVEEGKFEAELKTGENNITPVIEEVVLIPEVEKNITSGSIIDDQGKTIVKKGDGLCRIANRYLKEKYKNKPEEFANLSVAKKEKMIWDEVYRIADLNEFELVWRTINGKKVLVTNPMIHPNQKIQIVDKNIDIAA